MKIIHNTLFKKVIFYTIILNLIAMVIELESNLDNRFIVFLENFELLSITIFSIGYIISASFEDIINQSHKEYKNG